MNSMKILFKSWSIRTLEMMWRNWNPCTLLVEMESGTATMKTPLQLLSKLNKITMWLRNPNPKNTSKRIKNGCSNKNLYVNILRSTIHNSWKVEANQMSTIWWMNEQKVYPHNGILFIIQIYPKTWIKLRSIMLNKRCQTQRAIYCMILFLYEISRIG